MAVNNTIFRSLFGDMPEARAADEARAREGVLFQSMLDSRKSALEQERTDAKRMATFQALGNVLNNIFLPAVWGGKATTAPVQFDNRQYLESFNRALKASEDLRNIGTMRDEYNFQRAKEDSGIIRSALGKAIDAKNQQEYARQRHEYTMDEIAARGEAQLDVAKYKAEHKVTGRSGIPIGDKMLQTAWTQYMAYKKQYDTDTGRGIIRQEGEFPTFEEWVGDQFGWDISAKTGTQSGVAETKPSGSGRKPNPMGGATQTGANGKKKNPMNPMN